MALGRVRSRINVKGGGYLSLRQMSPTPSDAFLDLGYLQQTALEDTRNMVESMDERGLSIDFIEGSSAPVLRATLKQTTLDEINQLRTLADGYYYEIYYKVKLANGYIQELDAPLCKIKPGPVMQFGAATERQLELEIHFLAVLATTTVTRAPVAYNLDPTVNPYYVITENAAAQGAPSDTASAIKTLVF